MRSYRARNGSAIAEFGPALVLLFVFIAFPMLAALGLGAQYACAWYHHHLMLEELSERTAADGNNVNPALGVTSSPSDGGAVHTQIVNTFDQTGMAKFSGAMPPGFVDTVTYYGPTAVLPPRVACTTTLTAKPFICIPLINFTHMTFTVGGETTREVTQ